MNLTHRESLKSVSLTHLPKVLPLLGFFNGSVVPVVRPRPCSPALPPVPCSQCSTSAATVFDRPTGLIARFSLSCQHEVPHDGDSLPPQTPVPPAPALPTTTQQVAGSRTVLWRGFASLYGWGRGNPTHPGSGTQLALAESRMGVPPCSTGDREQVASEESQFWTAHTLNIIRAYADHFHSLDCRQPAASLFVARRALGFLSHRRLSFFLTPCQ